MLHHRVFWLMAVGIMLAVALVAGGLLRMREQRRHVGPLLRRALKAGRGLRTGQSPSSDDKEGT
jgi:hypothetical protein